MLFLIMLNKVKNISSLFLIIAPFILSCSEMDTVIMPILFKTNTEYVNSFSKSTYDTIMLGTSRDEVLSHLGYPFHSDYFYSMGSDKCGLQFRGKHKLNFKNCVSLLKTKPTQLRSDIAKLEKGKLIAKEVRAILGDPEKEVWIYSRSPTSNSYIRIEVHFKDGKVSKKERYFYLD